MIAASGGLDTPAPAPSSSRSVPDGLSCRHADTPCRAAFLLSDEKEAAEHVKIIDLIRNDIGRTAELLRDAEGYERGWYTGVFGFFDGAALDSAVMIRFIERTESGSLVYKSGGGVTLYSDMEAEYREMKAKVYAPFC